MYTHLYIYTYEVIIQESRQSSRCSRFMSPSLRRGSLSPDEALRMKRD